MTIPTSLAAALLSHRPRWRCRYRRRRRANKPDAAVTTQPAGSPESQSAHEEEQEKKSSSAEDFLDGYHAAYALIYDKADYVDGIAALRALGYDDNADVATLIGYASRKLGRYDDAKFWYERALAADPNHAVTWSYYGMWQAEQGNVLKAKDDLEKVRLICGIPNAASLQGAQGRDRRHGDVLEHRADHPSANPPPTTHFSK